MNSALILEKMLEYLYALYPRKKPTSEREPRIIAHRGVHQRQKKIIENTQEAFAQAYHLGCWGIEFDIHACADEILVINHDPSLQRLWNKPLVINDLDFPTLRAHAPHIPTLDEIVARYSDKLHLFIEVKAPFSAKTALERCLSTLTPAQDFHLICLDEETLANLDNFPLASRLLIGTERNTALYSQLTIEKGYGGLLGHYFLMNKKIIQQLKAHNKKIGVGQINSKNSFYREINRNIDWIFTDYAAELLKIQT